MKDVTEPLGEAFDAVGRSLQVVGDLFGVLGKDIGWLIGSIGKTEGEFSLLRAAVQLLLSPFKMLELGIRGIYVLYLKMRSSLDPLNKEKKEEFNRADAELAIRTADLAGKSKQQQLAEARERLALTDPSLQSKKETELIDKWKNADWRTAEGRAEREKANLALNQLRYQALRTDPERDKKLVEMLEGQVKDETRPKGTKSTLNGKAVEWNGSQWVEPKGQPDAKDVPKDIAGTYETTKEQVKEITEVGRNTEQTTGAVKELTAKITAQTSVQTTVAAIYNLLASGSLRVQGNLGNLNFNGGGGNPPRTDKLPIPGESTSDYLNRMLVWPDLKPKKVSTNNLRPQGTAAGDTILTTNITVNGANQDADEIATLVATKFSDAVEKLRSSNIIFTS